MKRKKEEKKKGIKKEWRRNKAGYTANTIRGRVGRGGNARFHTFQLDHHGPTDQRTDRRTKPLIELRVRN